MILRSLLLWCCILALAPAFAQPGQWLPAGSSVTYPRLLLSDTSIVSVRLRLNQSTENFVYSLVCDNAFGSVNPDNVLDYARRARASQAKNAAFVVLMNAKFSAGSTISLSGAESLILKAKAILLLNTMNKGVDSISLSNISAYESWQWRSKEIIDYATAYDMLKGAGATDLELLDARTNLKEFAGNLYKESTRSIVGLTFWDLVKNNFTFIVSGALGTAAVVLNTEDSSDSNYKPLNWIHCAMWQTDNLMFRDNSRESEYGKMSGFAEGPHYMLYSFMHLLPFFNGLKNFTGDFSSTFTYKSKSAYIRNPYFDPNYKLIYQWAANIRMPDGRLPALDDSFMDDYPSILLQSGSGNYYFDYYFGKTNTEPALVNFISTLNFSGQDMAVNFLCCAAPRSSSIPQPENTMPDAGSLIFRSGTDSLSTYMHINAEHGIGLSNGGGHNHADELSFILYSKGQLLALDPGYLNYVMRNDVCQASNHNMILVDGAGTASGTPGFPGGANAFIEDACAMNAFRDALARTAYNGVTIERKVLFIRNTHFMMGDFIQAPVTHKYTWQLHGFGLENGNNTTGFFYDSLDHHKAIWMHNNVSLLADIVASNGVDAYIKGNSKHEESYAVSGQHTALLVHKSEPKVQFASTLIPYEGMIPSTFSVNKGQVNYVETKSDGYYNLMITSPDSILRSYPASDHQGSFPSIDLQSDASLVYYSKDSVQQFNALFLQQGTFFQSSDSAAFTIKSNRRMDIGVEVPQRDKLTFYTSRSAKIKITSPFHVNSVSGTGFLSWSYDSLHLELTVNTKDSGFFEVAMDSVYAVKTGIHSQLKKAILLLSPNPGHDHFTVQGLDAKFDNLVMIDALGKVVHTADMKGLETYRFGLQVPAGIYFIRCSGPQTLAELKCIVQ